MPAKCPCGKNKCDCCKKKAEESGLKDPDFDARFDDRNMSFLGGQKSKVQIAWVKKHCKFAAPRTHQDIQELPDRPGLNIIKPFTPDALEESEWGRIPEDPKSTETFMNMHKRDLAERLKDAQYALSKIGTQQPSWSLKSGNDFVSYTSMMVVALKDALAIAQTLEVFSQHNRQQTPGESARLGSSRPSAKNAAFGNADPLNADPSAKNAVPSILPQNADQQPAPKNAAPIAENADQGLEDYFDENSARDMAGSSGGMLIQDETERLAIENEEFNLGYKPPGDPSRIIALAGKFKIGDTCIDQQSGQIVIIEDIDFTGTIATVKSDTSSYKVLMTHLKLKGNIPIPSPTKQPPTWTGPFNP